MSRGGRAIALAWGVNAICALPLTLFGTLAVSIRNDLHFGTGEQGIAAAGIVLAAAATTAWVGRLVDRVVGSRWIFLAAAVAAVGLLGAALTARSFSTLVPWMAVAGFALGVAQPASDAFLHGAVPHDRQGRAFSLKQAIVGPGVGLLAGLAVPVAAKLGGWRNAFAGGSVLAIVVACAAAWREWRERRERRERASASASASVGVGEVRAQTPTGGVLPLLPLLTLAAAGGLATAPQAAFVAFAVSSATEYGFGHASAGLLFSASCVPAIAVRLLLGRRVDLRIRTDILGLVAALLAVSAGGFILMSTGSTLAVAVGMPVLAATAWSWHGLFFLVVVRTSPAAPGRATGIAGSGALVGAVLGPMLFGLSAEWSFAASWLFTGAFSLAAAGFMLLTRRAVVSALGSAEVAKGSGHHQRLSRPP